MGGLQVAARGVALASRQTQAGPGVVDATVLGPAEGSPRPAGVVDRHQVLVTQRLLGMGDEQPPRQLTRSSSRSAGRAIAAVLGLYWNRRYRSYSAWSAADADGRALPVRILVAFSPAALVGFPCSRTPTGGSALRPWPVVVAWAVGGAALLVWRPAPGTWGLLDMTMRRRVLVIGLVQMVLCGPARVAASPTIVAALAAVCRWRPPWSSAHRLLTLSAATVYDLGQNGEVRSAWTATPLLGVLLPPVCRPAWRWKWVRTVSANTPSRIFGWYRLASPRPPWSCSSRHDRERPATSRLMPGARRDGTAGARRSGGGSGMRLCAPSAPVVSEPGTR
ncbi:MAG: undecaprenyl-diphosphate phosphatase [Ilumatobacteraceae bacterium]